MVEVYEMEWKEYAKCRDMDRELFFPTRVRGPNGRREVERAKAVCRRCPVIERCLQHALTVPEKFGVWGGLDEVERRELRRRDLLTEVG